MNGFVYDYQIVAKWGGVDKASKMVKSAMDEGRFMADFYDINFVNTIGSYSKYHGYLKSAQMAWLTGLCNKLNFYWIARDAKTRRIRLEKKRASGRKRSRKARKETRALPDVEHTMDAATRKWWNDIGCYGLAYGDVDIAEPIRIHTKMEGGCFEENYSKIMGML